MFDTTNSYNALANSNNFGKSILCCRFPRGKSYIAVGTNNQDIAMLDYQNTGGGYTSENKVQRSGTINAVDWNDVNF